MPTARFVVRLALLVVALGVALVLHGLWRSVRRRSPWPRLLLAAVARICGVRRRIVGRPLRRDVVYLANHLSWLDTPLLAGATGCAFVAHAGLREAPLVGWLCRLNHTIFVERDDRLSVTRQIGALRHALAGGWPVALFPEGTTGDGAAMLPFKPALFAALDPPPPGVVVQPVRIDYGRVAPELVWGRAESGRDHARRILERRGSFVATLHFLAPIDPAALPGRKAIAAEARRRLEAAGERAPAAV